MPRKYKLKVLDYPFTSYYLVLLSHSIILSCEIVKYFLSTLRVFEQVCKLFADLRQGVKSIYAILGEMSRNEPGKKKYGLIRADEFMYKVVLIIYLNISGKSDRSVLKKSLASNFLVKFCNFSQIGVIFFFFLRD